jgi:hypothetical protein
MDVLAAAGRSCAVTLDIHTVDALSWRSENPLAISGPNMRPAICIAKSSDGIMLRLILRENLLIKVRRMR